MTATTTQNVEINISTLICICVASISAVIGALARLTESWNEASYLATVAIG